MYSYGSDHIVSTKSACSLCIHLGSLVTSSKWINNFHVRGTCRFYDAIYHFSSIYIYNPISVFARFVCITYLDGGLSMMYCFERVCCF